MSEAFYNRMAATADRLLRQFGQPREVVLVVPNKVDDGSDPWEPGDPAPADEYTVFGVVIQPRQDGVKGNTLVSDKERRVKLSPFTTDREPLPVEPAVGHSLSFDGHAWSISNVGGSNPGGVRLLWEIEVAR